MQVLVLCHGGGSLGAGHVMRSLALAEAAVDAGHDVVVAGHFQGSLVRGQLDDAPIEVVHLAASVAEHDLRQFVDLARRLSPDVLHIDSYEAPGRLGKLVGDVVVSNVEDGAFGRRPADVVVDPTLGAELSARPDDGSTWLLRGSRYAPLRRRVIDARNRATNRIADATADASDEIPVDDVARTVLVVMGGSDPAGLTPAVVDLLARTGLALAVTAIAVGENADQVRAAARGSALSLTVLAPVGDLAAVMSGQDLVISAAGTSLWELCCIGAPMAVLWAVDNQREGYDRVVAAGAAVGLGGPELGGSGSNGHERAVGLLRTALTDPRVRADLALAGRDVVDGLGAWRVVRTWEQALRTGPSNAEPPGRLMARRAGMHDARLLWEWRNDAGTRASSREGELVPWLQHQAWLESSLAREDRLLLVVEDVGHAVGPLGTVRWDLVREGEWEASITVAPGRRGQSLARPLLDAAEVALCEAARSSGTHVTAYLAVVHVDNPASVRLFETSGYVPDLPPDPRGFMPYRKVAQVP